MSRLFKLETVGGYGSICPSSGEELGETLARLASQEMERCVANPGAEVMYWGGRVAQLFYLAADAYEAGAAVTIGHNRSDWYLTAASRHRKMGDELTAQAKLHRDRAASDRLIRAFLTGYQGGDGKRYAFDMREAYLIGQMYAKNGFDVPTRMQYEYIDGIGQMVVNGEQRYRVDYPEGKVVNAIIVTVD